eukprot:6639955-Ditylum_brightwellii.AAC.1
MPATIIQRKKDERINENGEDEPENTDDMKTRYGLQRRAGLQPRRRHNLVTSKFREQAHTMFQTGVDFPLTPQPKRKEIWFG